MKSGLPFMTFSDADQVISMLEVERCINMSLAGCIEEVRNEWKWIPVFLSDFVKTTVVNTKSEGAILFADERMGAPWGELECRMKPIRRCSSMNLRRVCSSD